MLLPSKPHEIIQRLHIFEVLDVGNVDAFLNESNSF